MGTSQFVDDKALFTYFDSRYRIHFIWDGYKNNNVAVSQGGIGEPLVASLAHHIDTTEQYPIDILQKFQGFCKIFVHKLDRVMFEHPKFDPQNDADVTLALYETVNNTNGGK